MLHDPYSGVTINFVRGPDTSDAVQIDHVQELRSGFGKQHRLRGGVIAIDGGAVHIAFGKADDLPALQINRGKNDEAHGRHSRKRDNKASP